MEPKVIVGGKRGIRPKVSDLLDNALMRELMGIRIDTLWRMLGLAAEERLPGPEAEGATGQLDNKGALFVPGGLVFDDSDRKPIRRERTGPMTAQRFRQRIRSAMRHDNATLLYPDGIAVGVNLDNGFFADIAGNILSNKQAAHKRRPPFEAKPAPRIDSEKITRSHCPTYVAPPYGSRTRLSSCVAVCLIETRLYYVACRKEFGLRGAKEEQELLGRIAGETQDDEDEGHHQPQREDGAAELEGEIARRHGSLSAWWQATRCASSSRRGDGVSALQRRSAKGQRG